MQLREEWLMRFERTEITTPTLHIEKRVRYQGIKLNSFQEVKDLIARRLIHVAKGRKLNSARWKDFDGNLFSCFFTPHAKVIGLVKRLLGMSPKDLNLDELYALMKFNINSRVNGKKWNRHEVLYSFEGEPHVGEWLRVERFTDDRFDGILDSGGHEEFYELRHFSTERDDEGEADWAEEIGMEVGLKSIEIAVSAPEHAKEFSLDMRMLREVSDLLQRHFPHDCFSRNANRLYIPAVIASDGDPRPMFFQAYNEAGVPEMQEFKTWRGGIKLGCTLPWGGGNYGDKWSPFEYVNGKLVTRVTHDEEKEGYLHQCPRIIFLITHHSNELGDRVGYMKSSIHDLRDKERALKLADDIVEVVKNY